MFFLTRDGANTLVSWTSAVAGAGAVSAYINDDWRFVSIPNADTQLITRSFRIDQSNDLYHLVLWPSDQRALPVPLPNNSLLDPADQAVLAKLTSAYAAVEASLLNPPPSPSAVSIANGNPRDYFRVREMALDTDGDGILDWHEIPLGHSPLDADTDGNGVEDPWDGISDTLVISEYQAENDSTIATRVDGVDRYDDWVEILNPTPAPISLSGWYLTDKPGGVGGETQNLMKWQFPTFSGADEIILDPGDTMLVWASGLNRKIAGEPLHASFKLDEDNDGTGLSTPDGTRVSFFRWTSAQVADRSAGWGIDNYTDGQDGVTREPRYFALPTPGELNRESAFIGNCAAPLFSQTAGIYSGAQFPVGLTNPNGFGVIHYTTDFSEPSADSPVYAAPIMVDGTTIIRAAVYCPGHSPSPMVSASYLIEESVLGKKPQGQEPTEHQVKPPSYSDTTSQPPHLIDYAMNSLVIKDHRDVLAAGLSAIPTISISLPPEEFFEEFVGAERTGIYANASHSKTNSLDGLENKWERLGSIEYINPAINQYDQETGRISISGGSSINPASTPKHGLKIEFRKSFSSNAEGVMNFSDQPFMGSTNQKFRTLMLRNPTHDSWLYRQTAPSVSWAHSEATYVKETWARETHALMGEDISPEGHLAMRRRWVHLYIDGLYWGIYELGERVNEDTLQVYSQPNAQFDVLKQSAVPYGAAATPDELRLEDGDFAAWDELITRVEAADADHTDTAAWVSMEAMLDLDNYIDYLMVNMYLFNQDWPANNLRCARRKDLDGVAGELNSAADNTPFATGSDAQRFKFYIWDCELVMRQGYVGGGNNTDGTVGAARIHGLMLDHPTYQARWKARVVQHFDTAGGVFSIDASGIHAARQRFDAAVSDLGSAIDCEWARWGDGGVGNYTTANWQSNTSTLSPLFETRRAVFLNQLRAKNLAD